MKLRRRKQPGTFLLRPSSPLAGGGPHSPSSSSSAPSVFTTRYYYHVLTSGSRTAVDMILGQRGGGGPTARPAWLVFILCCCGTLLPWPNALVALLSIVVSPRTNNSRRRMQHPFRYPPTPMTVLRNHEALDLGGLEMHFLSSDHFRRHIRRDDTTQYERYRQGLFAAMDDPRRKRKVDSPCQPPPWTLDTYPSCNIVHEIANLHRVDPDEYAIKQLGRGATFRIGFLFAKNETRPKIIDTRTIDAPYYPYANDFVLKTMKYRYTGSEIEEHLERVKEEALLMNHLTSSNRVTNIYGHCGTSVLVERGQDLFHKLVPYADGQVDDDMRGYIAMPDLDRLHDEHDGLYRRNAYTDEERLDIVIAIMESVALLHGFPAGPVAHNDISFDQWLLSMDGKRVFLNDFNSAVPLKYNAREDKYCMHTSESGNYKSPEYFHRPLFLSEAADVWALGCIVFGVLTGVLPYHEYFHDEDYMERTQRGLPPYLNPAFRSDRATYIERRLAEIMDDMFSVAPSERVSIFDVVERLHETRHVHYEHVRHHRKLDRQHRLLLRSTTNGS